VTRARRGNGAGRPAPPPAEAGTNLLIHDLKNLAGRLGALLQNLDEHYDDPLFKGTALGVLDDTVLHLKQLARDLRARESRVIVKLKVDVNRIVEDAVREVRSDLAGEVELVEHYAALPPIWGDVFLLRCAFACAIENAVEAMRGTGVLALSTACTRRNGRERIVVEVADTGPGMSDEFIRRVMIEPFASTKDDGMGLGVYTFRQVAALHGGAVRIKSREGLGTRVRFHFPVEIETASRKVGVPGARLDA
jgi:signal transduction histidine kinase